jgi:hypothetical protein
MPKPDPEAAGSTVCLLSQANQEAMRRLLEAAGEVRAEAAAAARKRRRKPR